MRSIYVIGSLRNKSIPVVAASLRAAGHEAFDDWFGAGPEADDHWQALEKSKGHELPEALKGYAAQHVFEFDRTHLNRCDTGVLVLPAGRSGHLELGYATGLGKDTAILMEGEPERYDVMYNFATLGVFYKLEDLVNVLGTSASTDRDRPVLGDGVSVLGQPGLSGRLDLRRVHSS